MCEGLEVEKSKRGSKNREKARVAGLGVQGGGCRHKMKLGRRLSKALLWGPAQLVWVLV